MSNEGGTSDPLLGNPGLSSVIDRDEVVTESPAKPATAAEAQKTATPGDESPDATDDNAATQEAEQEEQEARKQSRRQRKLESERQARTQAEQRAAAAEKELAELKAPKPKAEPNRDDFEDYESYLRAVNKYDTEQTLENAKKADREEAAKQDAQKKAQREYQAQADDWSKREAEFVKKVPSYEKDVTAFLDSDIDGFAPDARALILELGPELLHHLATNEDDVEAILKLSPLRQVAALGGIKLDAAQAAQNKADTSGDGSEDMEVDSLGRPEKPATEAKQSRTPPPPPAKHVRGGNSAPAELSDDMDTYIKQRAKQGARWARH